MSENFPNQIVIANTICKNCRQKEFIVDGQTQICSICGELNFREFSKIYNLNQNNKRTRPLILAPPCRIKFPQSIKVSISYCRDCDYYEFVVSKTKVVCQSCLKTTELKEGRIYELDNETH